jgi:UDP-glucose 4-epimerase
MNRAAKDSLPILIIGGAGFIGSHVNKLLNEKGYKTFVFDNLSRGNRRAVLSGEFVFGDISDINQLYRLFRDQRFSAIMHFAALTDVGASIKNPLKYYHDNVVNSWQLINMALTYDIKNFVFSSSAAIYGAPQQDIIDETHLLQPINPYGQSKLMVEKMLEDCDRAHGLKSCCLRYFNATGGDPYGMIRTIKRKENNLIPLLFQSILDPNAQVTIFGDDYPTKDGTCIRDYIHVTDLAQAHLLGLEHIMNENRSVAYNLGNGQGYSVKEVIAAVERVTEKPVNIIQGPRRPGDPAVLVADSTLAKNELGWQPRFSDLDVMIKHAWACYDKG